MTKAQKNWLIAGGVLGGILLLSNRASAAPGGGTLATLSYLGQTSLPLGMSRNNPGNIEAGIGYKGEINPDGSRFAAFQTWAYGIRAMIVLLRKYITSGSSYPNPCVTTPQNTVALIITQWAPPKSCGGDNPDAVVNQYIANVARWSGLAPNQILQPNQATLRRLVMAMARQEQGRDCVTAEQFNYAYTLS